MENVYVQWFSLKNGRYLLFLTNGEESSFFFFEQPVFWKETRCVLSKYMIQVNFAERYELIEPIGKGSFSKVTNKLPRSKKLSAITQASITRLKLLVKKIKIMHPPKA
jgi:hypothetical protein